MKVCLLKNVVSKASALLVFLVLFTNYIADAFEVNTYLATLNSAGTETVWPIIDPEFDDVNYRVLWQSNNVEADTSLNHLCICYLRPDGKFCLSQRQELASELSPINNINSNGPEWVHSATGRPSIIYTEKGTSTTNKYQLEAIQQDNNDGWSKMNLNFYGQQYSAIGTFSGNTGDAKIAYFAGTDTAYRTIWRNLHGDTSERLISYGRVQTHFSFDGTQMAVALPDNDDESVDPCTFDFNTGTSTVAYERTGISRFPYVLNPSACDGCEIMLYTLETSYDGTGTPPIRSIVVDKKAGTGWVTIRIIGVQSTLERYITSLEPFEVNGKPYVAYATENLNFTFGSIWIASLDPTDNTLGSSGQRKITPNSLAKRYEPEPLKLSNGKAIVYYNYYDGGDTQSHLMIAETGLQEGNP